MKKAHKAVPERMINKLVNIRKALLAGDVDIKDKSEKQGNRADELYMDMDVGNIVSTNPAYADLEMNCEALCRSLTAIT